MAENNGNGRMKFDGTPVFMGGQDWVVPSLSTVQAKTYWPKMVEMDEGVTVENFPEKRWVGVEIIHAAMSRNYPALTIDEVGEMVDLMNFRRLILIVSGQPNAVPAPGPVPVAASQSVK